MRKHTGMKTLFIIKANIIQHIITINMLLESTYFDFSLTQSIAVYKNVHGYGTFLDIGNYWRTITNHEPWTQELQGTQETMLWIGS